MPVKTRLLLLSLVAAALPAPADVGAATPPPRLVVVLVIDQMRSDYIDRFQHQWKAGLRRLLTEGAWFRQAAYPYLNTVTCPGHATIATGSFPAKHGQIQNEWWDRAAGRRIRCTEDAGSPSIGYGGNADGGHSTHRLRLPTLADELRLATGGQARVVSVSLKPRAAVMLAGRRADAVLWFDDAGVWATSSAYTAGPVPAVEEFLASHPIARDFEKTWTKALADGDYLYEDDGIGERPEKGWRATFPHPLKGDNGTGHPALYWQQSPFADEYVGRLASALVEKLGLGRDAATDFLGVSFSALDRVGHDFGPHSHEVQDVLARLDRTIGALLADLDRLVGRDEYVLAVSSDHGISPIPERSAQLGFEAGRLRLTDIGARVDAALVPHIGPGRHVASVVYTDVYFLPGVYDRLVANPAAMQTAVEAIRSAPGVWRVYRGDHLTEGRYGDDPVARAAVMSYHPGRSGDLILVPAPYWHASADAATHGTSHAYDARVPLILLGRGVRPGEYLQPATPADIAPTLAFLSGVTLAQADGRVLADALAASAPGASPKTSAQPPRRRR